MAFFESKLWRFAGLAGLATLAAAGCGAAAPQPADTTAMLSSCDTETRAMPYAPNSSRTSASGSFTGVLVDSVPGPPIKGTNDWTVRILDAGGNPVAGLAFTALPKMPDHTHPTSVVPVVTEKGGGLYDLSPVYLFMPGYWTVTLTLSADPNDDVVFPVCIPS
jgi:YtkA-like